MNLQSFSHSGCQKNVPVPGRFFAATPYAAILFFETLLRQAVKKCPADVGKDPRLSILIHNFCFLFFPSSTLSSDRIIA